MSAEIINLRVARKKKARVQKEQIAEQNRTKFGRSKAEKTLSQALIKKAKRDHDAGHIEKNQPDE